MLPPLLQPAPEPLALSDEEISDAEFVRTATLHREPRLADARFYLRGPNTATDRETIYLFASPPADGLCRVMAVSVPDAVVATMDARLLRRVYEERDAAGARGGPWWIKPIGAATATT